MNTLQPQIDKIAANNLELERLRELFKGIASNEITLRADDWRSLMESGVLANLSISRYRGHKALTAADLGLDQDDFNQVNSILQLGVRLLLPKSILGQFNSLESNARQVLRRYTLRVPAGYFLPASAYQSCAAAMENSKAKFAALVESLIDNLPMYRSQVLDQYLTLAAQVSRRLQAAGILSYAGRDTFEDEFIARCMATFPVEDDLRRQFRFDLQLQFSPLPYQTTQTETPMYANPSEDLRELRRAVIAEQSRIETEEIRGFISSIQSEVYTIVNEGLTNVLDSIQDKGFIQSRSSVQLRGIVDRLGQLNFWNDARLELIKSEIAAILDRSPSKRDIAIDTTLIATMRDEIAQSLLKLGTVERGDFNLSTESPQVIIAQPQPQPIKIPALQPQVNLDRRSPQPLSNRVQSPSKRLF